MFTLAFWALMTDSLCKVASAQAGEEGEGQELGGGDYPVSCLQNFGLCVVHFHTDLI